MPTITGTEKMFDGLAGKITSSMLDMINASPTLVSQLNEYNKAVETGQAAPMSLGNTTALTTASGLPSITFNASEFTNNNASYYDGNYNFHPVSADAYWVGTLAHELGHYDAIAADLQLRREMLSDASPGEVTTISTFADVYREGRAIYNNWIAQREIIDNRAGEISLSGSNLQYGNTPTNNSWSNIQVGLDKLASAGAAAGLSAEQVKNSMIDYAASQAATLQPNGTSTGTTYWSDLINRNGGGTDSTAARAIGSVDLKNSLESSGAISIHLVYDDGSQLSNIFNTDGSSSGKSIDVDGRTASYEDDGHGNRTTTYSDENGNKTGKSVTAADGSGNVTTSNYDATGTLTGDTWSHPDGSHGSNSYNADGSSTSTTIGADGTKQVHQDDGSGNSQTQNYDKNGVLTNDHWQRNDGASGTNAYLPDGTIASDTWRDSEGNSGTDTFAVDGSWTSTSSKTNGDSSTVHGDGSGTSTTEWERADGSHGTDVQGPNYGRTGVEYNSDGSRSEYALDGYGLGNSIHYDTDGKEIGYSTIGRDDSGGHSTVANYDVDGNLLSRTVYNADDSGNRYTTTYSTTYDNEGGRTVAAITESISGDGYLAGLGPGYDLSGNDASGASATVATSTTTYRLDGSSTETSVEYRGGETKTRQEDHSPDGSYRVDYQDSSGYREQTNYDATTGEKDTIRTQADGSRVSDSERNDGRTTEYYDGNGNLTVRVSETTTPSGSDTIRETYGIGGTYQRDELDSAGNHTVQTSDSNGSTLNATYADGSSLSENRNADGLVTYRHSSGWEDGSWVNRTESVTDDGVHVTSVGQSNPDHSWSDTTDTVYLDGSHSVSSSVGTDATRESRTENYDSSNRLISDHWENYSDKWGYNETAYGNDSFNTDGSGAGYSHYGAGNDNYLSYDGHGEIDTTHYNNDVLTSMERNWDYGNGNHGMMSYFLRDGIEIGSDKTEYSSDGTYYNVSNWMGFSMTKINWGDGAKYGETDQADGSVQKGWVSSDGSYQSEEFKAGSPLDASTFFTKIGADSIELTNSHDMAGLLSQDFTYRFADEATFHVRTEFSADGSRRDIYYENINGNSQGVDYDVFVSDFTEASGGKSYVPGYGTEDIRDLSSEMPTDLPAHFREPSPTPHAHP